MTNWKSHILIIDVIVEFDTGDVTWTVRAMNRILVMKFFSVYDLGSTSNEHVFLAVKI